MSKYLRQIGVRFPDVAFKYQKDSDTYTVDATPGRLEIPNPDNVPFVAKDGVIYTKSERKDMRKQNWKKLDELLTKYEPVLKAS